MTRQEIVEGDHHLTICGKPCRVYGWQGDRPEIQMIVAPWLQYNISWDAVVAIIESGMSELCPGWVLKEVPIGRSI